MQTYSKSGMDVVVAATGSQNVTFLYDDYGFRQRIDVRSKLGGKYQEPVPLLNSAKWLTSILDFRQASTRRLELLVGSKCRCQ